MSVDYLAYDLLFLKRLDEAMKIVDRFEPVLGDDRDLPLISGYVNAQHDEYEPAVRDFTHALQIDPKMAVGYMNRGYVYNDMRLATKAEQDFRSALALNPQYGEAHLGLAYALVQLRRPSPALKEAEAATRLLPDSESLHLVKAEAYRQRAMLAPAEGEYQKALKLNPNPPNTYIALADVQYRAHKFDASAATLQDALAVAPNNPMILAQLGRSYAKLGRANEAMQAIASAERAGGKDYKILLVAADALRILNRRDQAMTTYEWALESSDADRLQVRLALGQLFAEEGKAADAQQQIAIGFAEARVAPVDVTTADDYLNAASTLMSIHEYPLAQLMYGRAQALGATSRWRWAWQMPRWLWATRAARRCNWPASPTIPIASTTTIFWSARATSTGNSARMIWPFRTSPAPTNWIRRIRPLELRKWNLPKKKAVLLPTTSA